MSQCQNAMLSQCADVSGDKAALLDKEKLVKILQEEKGKGDAMLAKLEELYGTVSRSTSSIGCKKLKGEILEIKESWGTHCTMLQDIELNVEKATGQWSQFEDDLQRHSNWFRHYENIFKSQHLQGTGQEKHDMLKMFLAKRADIVAYERTIDDFVNQSHVLLQNSGAEQLKPLITQISNRYQLLHVLSKEVVAKWQGITEDHESYNETLKNLQTYLEKIRGKVEEAKAGESSRQLEVLQDVIAEKENVPVKIQTICSFGEKLFVDTSACGREAIREELRILQKDWDLLLSSAIELMKSQDNKQKMLGHLRERVSHANQWLDSANAGLDLDKVNWLSVQETRSRLHKIRSDLQDIIAYKHVIDAIIEDGQGAIRQSSLSDELQTELNKISSKYERVISKAKSLTTDIEGSVDYIQQYHELQASQSEWLKKMWGNLATFDDLNGSRPVVELRRQKFSTLEAELKHGEQLKDNIKKHISQSHLSKVTQSAKQFMETEHEKMCIECANLTTSYMDICSALDSRIRQWSDHDAQHEKLVSWLSEAEQEAKTFSFSSTMETKLAQQSKFQVRSLDNFRSKNLTLVNYRNFKPRLIPSTHTFRNMFPSQTN